MRIQWRIFWWGGFMFIWGIWVIWFLKLTHSKILLFKSNPIPSLNCNLTVLGRPRRSSSPSPQHFKKVTLSDSLLNIIEKSLTSDISFQISPYLFLELNFTILVQLEVFQLWNQLMPIQTVNNMREDYYKPSALYNWQSVETTVNFRQFQTSK